jgi:NADPH2:quinone reductase
VQRAGISAGETLLVLGAAGGVGLAAVQLGKALGARVIAAASSQEKIDVALAQGADQGVIYGAEESELRALSQRFKETADGGFDVVVDPVGGALAEAAVRALNWSGRFLIVGFPAGIPRLPLNLLLLKGAAATGVFYGSFAEKEPAANAANNDALLKLYAKGAIRPVISDRYVFNEAPQAIMDLAARQAHGKLVVMIGQDR